MSEAAPIADAGNALLAEQPAQMSCALVDTAIGQRLLVTIRTPSTTLTLFLAGADAKQWTAVLAAQSGAMSSTSLVVANGTRPHQPPGG